jgi:ABC-type Fe3+-citrate transport system substrate-binding protein
MRLAIQNAASPKAGSPRRRSTNEEKIETSDLVAQIVSLEKEIQQIIPEHREFGASLTLELKKLQEAAERVSAQQSVLKSEMAGSLLELNRANSSHNTENRFTEQDKAYFELQKLAKEVEEEISQLLTPPRESRQRSYTNGSDRPSPPNNTPESTPTTKRRII